MSKTYDLENRTYEFARNIRLFLSKISHQQVMSEDRKQLLRSSGSVGANFIEAKEGLSRKDFIMRIRICRKEVEETRYWLRLLKENTNNFPTEEHKKLIQEAFELQCIFGSIINKYRNN